MIVSSLFVDPKKEYTKSNAYYRFLLNATTVLAIKLCRVKVHVTGREKIPEGTRFLLAGNHRSNFDPIITWYVLHDKDISYISKADNFNVPFFGRIVRKCGFMAIDRSDPRSAVKTVNKAAQMMRSDSVSVGVYPEGTRSKKCVLLPFHNGIFSIAQKAGVPIVIVAIQGSENVHKNWYKKRTDVYLDFIDVIPVSELRDVQTNAIGERVRESLSEELRDHGIGQE